MLKQYAASMLLVALLTLVGALSLYVAPTSDTVIQVIAGTLALGAYVAGLSDLQRHGISGRIFGLVRRWALLAYLAIVLITSYI
ncbi:MAG: hypothetical protein LBL94_06525 [Prevotellaceae bacterium]|nr:hypothetical protein [Prevotellaceae bacterium]